MAKPKGRGLLDHIAPRLGEIETWQELELRKWCVEQSRFAPIGRADEVLAHAQQVYEWVKR